MTHPPAPPTDLPQALTSAPRKTWLPSIIWLLPILAVLIGIGLVTQIWLQRGSTITLTFSSADGLEANRTKLKFRNVNIGEVKEIQVAPDQNNVIVTIELKKEAAQFAAEDSRFWVVRPRIAGSAISGLSTLVSGAYIGVDLGRSKTLKKEFVGLETPPPITSDVPGKHFVLQADDMGSIDVGSPIFYRHIEVGQVTESHLNNDGQSVTLHIFVRSPYDRFVSNDTRFWHASGLDLQLTAAGVQMNTESLASILIGGIAFATPDFTENTTPAAADTNFHLAASRTLALAPPDTAPFTLVMRFDSSVRGLTLGAPIDFRGLTLGNVHKIEMAFDEEKRTFYAKVTAHIFMNRFGPELSKTLLQSHLGEDSRLLGDLIKRGLRAQMRPGNLLTGQLYIALDFFPNAPKVTTFKSTEKLAHIPTIAGELEELQQQLAGVVRKINKIPFDELEQEFTSLLK